MQFKPGVLTGTEVTELLNHANDNKFALPAVNVTGSNTINAVLETAKAVQSPVMIQFSNGGAQFQASRLFVRALLVVLTGNEFCEACPCQ